ncbi:hypothetical protein QUF72_12505 [Desulfobacterales bacterium HSG2]|nr:hypothetical protein [Desulfobacterales bacterium HSG2]
MIARGVYFSEYAVVDIQENSLSVINVVEGLESSKFPLFLPKVTVTVLT